MLKVIFVSDVVYPYTKGGKEKRLHEIAKRLVTLGYDVHIYTMHWWSEPSESRIDSGVHLHAICKPQNLYKGDHRSIKQALIFGLSCFKLLRVPFDIIDVDHMPFFPIFSTWIVCKLRRRKMFATWHEALSCKQWISYMGISGIIASLIESLSIKLPNRITTISTHTKASLSEIHGREKGVEIVECGIDKRQLEQIEPAQAKCDVLYIGRLVKDKNVDKLISAIWIVAKKHPAIQCIVIGDGVEKRRLVEQANKLSLRDNILFLDPMPEASEVYAYMKAAKVFCSPSVREGFGITTLESLGCGTPAITVDSPYNASRDLIDNGYNGSIVPLSPKSIAKAITHWVYKSPKPSTTSVNDDYDWHEIAKKQAEVYSQ